MNAGRKRPLQTEQFLTEMSLHHGHDNDDDRQLDKGAQARIGTGRGYDGCT